MSTTINQNPEQIARDKIDAMLCAAGWLVQSKSNVDLSSKIGVTLRKSNNLQEIMETINGKGE